MNRVTRALRTSLFTLPLLFLSAAPTRAGLIQIDFAPRTPNSGQIGVLARGLLLVRNRAIFHWLRGTAGIAKKLLRATHTPAILLGFLAAFQVSLATAEGLPRFAFDHHVTVLNDSFSTVQLTGATPGNFDEFFSFAGVGGFGISRVPGTPSTQACLFGGSCLQQFFDGPTPRTSSFRFTVTSIGEGDGLRSLPGTVFITVVESIDGPLAFRQDASTVQNMSIPITPHGVDPTGAPLTFSIVSQPGNGSLRDGPFDNDLMIYEPNTDFVGVDTFSVVASNGVDTSPPVEFTVRVFATDNPFITEITPEVGTTIDNSEFVIRGFNFVSEATSVLVNGAEPLSAETRLDDSGAVELVVTVAPQPLGLVPVSVTTATGTSTNVAGFRFELPDTELVSAILPLARSVSVNTPATAFASVINSGNVSLTNCGFVVPSGLEDQFHFQTTDPQTNALTGTEDAAVNLGPLQAQSYVFSVLSSTPIDPTEIPLEYGCDGQVEVGIIEGINVFNLSIDADPVPDVIAVAAVPDSQNPPGTLSLPSGTQQQFFAVATSNIGAEGDITVTATANNPNLAITIQACSDPADCSDATSNVVQELQPANAIASYFFLVTSLDEVPFDPVTNRIDVVFTDSNGVLRGATSVAVTTRPCSLDDEVLCALLP